jgi:hypothetical protein
VPPVVGAEGAEALGPACSDRCGSVPRPAAPQLACKRAGRHGNILKTLRVHRHGAAPVEAGWADL